MTLYDLLPAPIVWIVMGIAKIIEIGAVLLGIATPILTVIALVMLIKYLRKKNREEGPK